MSTDAESSTDWGRAFHSEAAATAKERPPVDLRSLVRFQSKFFADERSSLLILLSSWDKETEMGQTESIKWKVTISDKAGTNVTNKTREAERLENRYLYNSPFDSPAVDSI